MQHAAGAAMFYRWRGPACSMQQGQQRSRDSCWLVDPGACSLQQEQQCLIAGVGQQSVSRRRSAPFVRCLVHALQAWQLQQCLDGAGIPGWFLDSCGSWIHAVESCRTTVCSVFLLDGISGGCRLVVVYKWRGAAASVMRGSLCAMIVYQYL